MKTIENFGAWVCGRGWWFVPVVAAMWGVLLFMDGAKTVTINARQFTCTATEAEGIDAVCTQFTKIRGAR